MSGDTWGMLIQQSFYAVGPTDWNSAPNHERNGERQIWAPSGGVKILMILPLSLGSIRRRLSMWAAC